MDSVWNWALAENKDGIASPPKQLLGREGSGEGTEHVQLGVQGANNYTVASPSPTSEDVLICQSGLFQEPSLISHSTPTNSVLSSSFLYQIDFLFLDRISCLLADLEPDR